MSVLTKKRHTNTIAITIGDKRPRRWVGPRSKLRLVRSLLSEMDFEPQEDSVPWREAFSEEISQHGEKGLALKGARFKEEMTQVELANKVGVSQYNISKMENGSRQIGKAMAKRLAKVLNIDYRVFL